MLRPAALLVALFILSGCMEQSNPESLDGVDSAVEAPPAEQGAPEPEVLHNTGNILLGVGAPAPVLQYANVELMVTAGMEFKVDEATRTLVVELDWDDGDVPNDLTLWVVDPDGDTTYVAEGLPGMRDRPRLEVDGPKAGTWFAGANASGVTATATWDVYASIFPTTPPEGYSALSDES